MALNLTTIRKTNPATLTILKKTALYGFSLKRPFLVARTGYATYGTDHPTANHLNPGDQVTITGILSAQEAGYAFPQIICKSPSGIEFAVFSTDIGRFLGL